MRTEGGSLPLALLVSIIVAGIVVVLVARTVASQRQVQFDQAYHGAMPAADAGVAVAKFRINADMELTTADDPESEYPNEEFDASEFPVDHRTVTETEELDGRIYTWFMTRRDGYWEVDSTSTDDRGRRDVQRRVLAELRDQPLVSLAAFADLALQMSGANTADSYSSDTGDWCTGNGIVASNRVVSFSGVASPGPCASLRPTGRTVDRVVLYNWEEFKGEDATNTYPGGDRCGQRLGGAGDPDEDVNVDPEHENCEYLVHPDGDFLEPLLVDDPVEPTVEGALSFINEGLAECETRFGASAIHDFRSTDDTGPGPMPAGGTTLSPAPAGHPEVGEFLPGLSGRFYCYEDVYLDADTVIDGAAGAKDPVILFVRGNLRLAEGKNMNKEVSIGCGPDGCTPGVSTPEAARLWIFVLGDEVGIRAQSEYAGVIWAPESDCGGLGPGQGGDPNAQVDIYGSLICGTIDNHGGWRFHFDEELGGITDGQHVLSRWQELPSGS